MASTDPTMTEAIKALLGKAGTGTKQDKLNAVHAVQAVLQNDANTIFQRALSGTDRDVFQRFKDRRGFAASTSAKVAGEAILDLAPALSRLNALPLAVDGTEVAAIKRVLDIYDAAVNKAQQEEDKKTGNSAPKVSISLDPVALVKEVDLALAQVCPLCSHSSAMQVTTDAQLAAYNTRAAATMAAKTAAYEAQDPKARGHKPRASGNALQVTHVLKCQCQRQHSHGSFDGTGCFACSLAGGATLEQVPSAAPGTQRSTCVICNCPCSAEYLVLMIRSKIERGSVL